ncbi:MAG: M50 family metallopeptidase [Acidimicrobiales bacterium]
MGELILLVAVVVSAIVVHEFAHVVATRAVGHEIFEIQIGGGPQWSFCLDTIDVRIGLFPLGGHVQTGARSGEGFRWRSAVVAGSGIAANLALAGVGLLTGISGLVGFNLLLVAVNLWPGGHRRLGVASSDGRVLFDLLRNDRDAMAEERSGWFCMRAMRARDAGALDEAAELVAQGRDAAGDTRALLAVAGVVAFEQRRFGDVVDAYAPLIDDERVTVAGRAGFAADAAWAASLSGDTDLRALAEPWAAFARRVRPRVERRSVVLALAQVDAGRPVDALDSLRGLDGPTASAVRVLALAATGELYEARRIHEDHVAHRLDDDHPLLHRAESVIRPPQHG